MGRGRQEKPVLKPRGEVADSPRDPAVDGVAVVGGRGGVVGLVENEQRAGPQRAEPVAQGAGVGLIDQEPRGDEPAGVGGPRVHGPAAFLADAFHRLPIECFEEQAEPGFELVAPL